MTLTTTFMSPQLRPPFFLVLCLTKPRLYTQSYLAHSKPRPLLCVPSFECPFCVLSGEGCGWDGPGVSRDDEAARRSTKLMTTREHRHIRVATREQRQHRSIAQTHSGLESDYTLTVFSLRSDTPSDRTKRSTSSDRSATFIRPMPRHP